MNWSVHDLKLLLFPLLLVFYSAAFVVADLLFYHNLVVGWYVNSDGPYILVGETLMVVFGLTGLTWWTVTQVIDCVESITFERHHRLFSNEEMKKKVKT